MLETDRRGEGGKGVGMGAAEEAGRGGPREAWPRNPLWKTTHFLSQVMQPLEGDICYANLTLQPTGTSHGSSQKKACTKPSSSALENQQEVDYVTMVCTWGCCGPWSQIGFLLPMCAQRKRGGCWAKPQPLKDLPLELPSTPPSSPDFWPLDVSLQQSLALEDAESHQTWPSCWLGHDPDRS